MAEGDLESLLELYDPEVVFLNRSSEERRGLLALKQELAPLAAARTAFQFEIKQVIRAGNIALMHTRWDVPRPPGMSQYAIEVARLQPDGTWRWLIGDPFTVGKHTKLLGESDRE